MTCTFRLANVVWRDQKIAGVLDWATARLGNPLFDLGWICMGARSEEDSIMGLVPLRRDAQPSTGTPPD